MYYTELKYLYVAGGESGVVCKEGEKKILLKEKKKIYVYYLKIMRRAMINSMITERKVKIVTVISVHIKEKRLWKCMII